MKKMIVTTGLMLLLTAVLVTISASEVRAQYCYCGDACSGTGYVSNVGCNSCSGGSYMGAAADCGYACGGVGYGLCGGYAYSGYECGYGYYGPGILERVGCGVVGAVGGLIHGLVYPGPVGCPLQCPLSPCPILGTPCYGTTYSACSPCAAPAVCEAPCAAPAVCEAPCAAPAVCEAPCAAPAVCEAPCAAPYMVARPCLPCRPLLPAVAPCPPPCFAPAPCFMASACAPCAAPAVCDAPYAGNYRTAPANSGPRTSIAPAPAPTPAPATLPATGNDPARSTDAPSLPPIPPAPTPAPGVKPVEEPLPPPAESLGASVSYGNEATFAVEVPRNAIVYVNGAATKSTGTVRNFASSNLQPGKVYPYAVQVLVPQQNAQGIQGTLVTHQGTNYVQVAKTVYVRAGEEVNLAFVPTNADPLVQLASRNR